MKKIVGRYLIGCFLFLSVFAAAQSDSALQVLSQLQTQAIGDCTVTICNYVYVEQVWLNTDGNLYVSTSGNENSLNCTPLGSTGTIQYLQMNQNALFFKEIYTAILAAHLADKRVLMTLPNSGPCLIGSAQLQRGQ